MSSGPGRRPGPGFLHRSRSWMNRILALLIVLGLGSSLLPPATCSGLGRSCCCAGSAGDAAVPVEAGTSHVDRACACGCPELASATAEAAPRVPAPARAETPAPVTIGLAAGPRALPSGPDAGGDPTSAAPHLALAQPPPAFHTPLRI